MANTVLIHGYGVGISPKRDPLSLDLGFTAFYNGLLNKDVELFSWYQEESHSLSKFLNLRHHLDTYKREKAAARSSTILQNLNELLEKEQPAVVVCHSLGAELFLNYLKAHTEPVSIKKTVFVQADFPNDQLFPPNANHIQFVNCFCPWDPALLTSQALNHYTPAGLLGWKQQKAHNKLVPLFGHWNLHNSSIMQKQFAKFVSSL